MRAHDNGNGIITGHPVEPLYGRTYLPKKFKIAFTVPGNHPSPSPNPSPNPNPNPSPNPTPHLEPNPEPNPSPGDNGVDLYINDIGAVVIMEPDGETLAGFNIVVGGGMGRAHKQEATFARAASHLGYVRKEMFFEAMKAILA